jgi:hypothetical protein
MGRWWRAGFIWAALGGLLAISIIMSVLGRMYFERIIAALADRTGPEEVGEPRGGGSGMSLSGPLSSGRPMLLAGVGIGGFLAIVYLMMFKPF